MIRLALAGLRHYWKLSLMLGAGVFLAAAVLTGSLLVGDSVKATLRGQAAERVGPVAVAFVGGERFFTDGLADDGAPALFVPGTISTPDKKKRANGIWIYGVDDRFWKLAGIDAPPEGDFIALGELLFERLGLELGARVTARMELPGRVSRDAPLSGETEKTATVSGAITHVIPSAKLGRFSLFAEQTPALNVFVPLETLQRELEKEGRANLVVSKGAIDDALASWELADAELKIREPASGGAELISDRVFVSDAVTAAVRAVDPSAEGVLSYLINRFETADAEVPYSVATGIGPVTAQRLAGRELADDEVLVNAWLAASPDEGGLGVEVGDTITLNYFEVDDSRQFLERQREMKVAGVIAMGHPQMGDEWVPEFPGLETADTLASWESGMPLDTKKIRAQDEEYWDDHRATPKAFVSLAAAQEMWGNRFGQLTALRPGAGFEEEAFGAKLRAQLSLTDLGMSLRRPQEDAAKSVAGALDFGALFGSLSGFLIISALLLVAMLVAFGMEARSAQIGLLGALGFSRFQVRKLFMWEGGLVSFVAAVLGALAGVLYTKAALWALGGVWRGAAAGMEFQFDARPASIVIGALATFVMAKLAIWFAGRKITAAPPRALLAGDGGGGGGIAAAGKWPRRLIVIGLVGGLVAMVAGFGLEGEKLAGAFFGAGFAFLLAGLASFALVLRKLERGAEKVDLVALGRRNAVRKCGRSIAVAAMVASGVFLVAAVNAFRLKADVDPDRNDTGTGGFEYIGSATLPVYDDLNDAAVRDKFGLEDYSTDELRFVRMRVRNDGEEASCLNLNAATRPRIVALDPEELASRGAFRFAGVWKGVREDEASPWGALSKTLEDGAVPAIGDKASVMWALKKKLGDTVAYPDGRGGEVLLRIVGLLENSVLQGNLVIADEAFETHFPSDGGYEMFMVDVASADPGAVMGEVTKGLDRRGVAFEGASDRLAAYAQVQNTYISIFSVLGGLGVLLGTVGVGLLIARNVLERRAEMGVMSALGFRRKALVKMVLSEHLMLVVAGVLIGAVAAVAAVAPNLAGRAAGFPLATVAVMVGAIAVAGLLFCLLAARLALRGSLLDAIRCE